MYMGVPYKETGLLLNYMTVDGCVDRVHDKANNETIKELFKAEHFEENTIEPVGYVLAELFCEQLTSACKNLQNLQCWAKKIGVKVVEPFALNSMLVTPLASSQSVSGLKFSDLIDMNDWNKKSVSDGNEEIVTWERFLREAPKDVIAVDLKQIEKVGLEIGHQVCTSNSGQEWPKQHLLKEIGFNVVQNISLQFKNEEPLTVDEFTTMIYKTLDPRSVTVYFRQWRDLSDSGRMPVKESGCYNTGLQEVMLPSTKLLQQAETYFSKYLAGTRYIAVIVRLEKSIRNFPNKPDIANYCLNHTLNQWRNVVSENGPMKTFLSIDVGRYGSSSLRNVSKDFKPFFHSLFGEEWSIFEWEKSFEEVGKTTDTGYIALLQKIIVTRATCVLFVGGGSFQKHALALYQARVPKAKRCIHVVRECTKKQRLKLYHDQ